MSVMPVGKAVPTSSLWLVCPPVPPTQQSTLCFTRGGDQLQPCAKGAVGQLRRTGAGHEVQTPVPGEACVHAANTVSLTMASLAGAWAVPVEEHSDGAVVVQGRALPCSPRGRTREGADHPMSPCASPPKLATAHLMAPALQHKVLIPVSGQASALLGQSPPKCLGASEHFLAMLGCRLGAPPQTQLVAKELSSTWDLISRLPCGHRAQRAQQLLSSPTLPAQVPTAHPARGYLPASSTIACHRSPSHPAPRHILDD